VSETIVKNQIKQDLCGIVNNTIFPDPDIFAKTVSDTLLDVIAEDLNCPTPMFLKIKDGFVEKIAQKIVCNPQKSILIGVAGESASGKTTLAQKVLSACIKGNAREIYTIIPIDDYYHDVSEELTRAGSYEALFATGFSFDSPDALNLNLLKEHLCLLTQGHCIRSPEHDFVTCRTTLNKKPKFPAKVILTDGLYALNEKFRDILDIAVYVYTPSDVISDRWYKRAASRGKTGKSADMQFKNVNNQAEKHVRPTIDNADIIVSGLVSSDYIEFLAEKFINSIKESLKN